MAKLSLLTNQGFLVDIDGDRMIEFITGIDYNCSSFGIPIKELLENETHLNNRDKSS